MLVKHKDSQTFTAEKAAKYLIVKRRLEPNIFRGVVSKKRLSTGVKTED